MKVTRHEHRGKADALLARSGYGKHPDAPQDRALVREMVKPAALKGRTRRADGGAVPDLTGKRSGDAADSLLIAKGSPASDMIARTGQLQQTSPAATNALLSRVGRARGGHVKEPKKSQVNILIAPQSHDDPGRPPIDPRVLAAAAGPRAPVAPHPMGAPAGGMGAPMGPGGMKRGGGVKMTAGGGSAEGRMEKVKLYGKGHRG